MALTCLVQIIHFLIRHYNNFNFLFCNYSGTYSLLSIYTASCNKHNLVAGLSKMLLFVCTYTLWTLPQKSSIVLMTRPIVHECHRPEESTIRTMSFTAMFLFCQYAAVHLRQNRSDRYCFCLQCLLPYTSFLSKTPGGNVGFGLGLGFYQE